MVPIMRCADPVDRDVEWVPPRSAHDPRLMLTGDAHRPGFFDAGSFDEIMKPWAQTVIAGMFIMNTSCSLAASST